MGSMKNEGNHASCGGLLRDDNGDFMAGFACNLGACTIMKVELSVIFHGLQLARSMNIARLEIMSDSNSAIQI